MRMFSMLLRKVTPHILRRYVFAGDIVEQSGRAVVELAHLKIARRAHFELFIFRLRGRATQALSIS